MTFLSQQLTAEIVTHAVLVKPRYRNIKKLNHLNICSKVHKLSSYAMWSVPQLNPQFRLQKKTTKVTTVHKPWLSESEDEDLPQFQLDENSDNTAGQPAANHIRTGRFG